MVVGERRDLADGCALRERTVADVPDAALVGEEVVALAVRRPHRAALVAGRRLQRAEGLACDVVEPHVAGGASRGRGGELAVLRRVAVAVRDEEDVRAVGGDRGVARGRVEEEPFRAAFGDRDRHGAVSPAKHAAGDGGGEVAADDCDGGLPVGEVSVGRRALGMERHLSYGFREAVLAERHLEEVLAALAVGREQHVASVRGDEGLEVRRAVRQRLRDASVGRRAPDAPVPLEREERSIRGERRG